MKINITLLILFFSIISFGQFGPQQEIIPSTDNPTDVYSVDLDNDGDIDILFASFYDNKVAWYENTDGNGNFSRQKIITTNANGARSIYSIDIDSDGDMDVLSASYLDNKIAWYENIDGNGNFGPQQIITSFASGGQDVYSCDIDGDGDMDVMSTSFNDNKIVWQENIDGYGNFGPQQIITDSLDRVESIFSSDIDGDGDMDVLSASYNDNKITWYENIDGNGNFGPQKIISTNANGARAIYSKDIDGDGDMDVLSASYDDNKIAWYENIDGNGNFGLQKIITTNANGVISLCASDIDGDGDIDVLSAEIVGDKIAWYENMDGNGNFGPQIIISIYTDGAQAIYSGDIDGDGDIDVLSASSMDNKIAWYENINGNGDFGSQLIVTKSTIGARAIYSGDIDSDGDMDVLSVSSTDNKIAWYENIGGSGNFGPQKIITTSAIGATFSHLNDIDSDGDIDVLSSSSEDNKIAWYENIDGNGNFGSQQTISTNANSAQAVYSCDLDNDGDIDVLSASSGDNKIAWYENIDGSGNFGPQQIITTNANIAKSVYPCDIDGDGDMDVLSASWNDDKIAWYENMSGNGSFGPQQIITTNADAALSVYSCDIDGDGDMDVLSASFFDNKIAWYENIDGSGNFGAQQIITTNANRAQSVYSCDIDGDGDMDVLSASWNDNKIAWYENIDGSGNFGAQQIITTNTANPISVYSCDIDGDEDMDVLSASWDDNKIAWYENLSIPTHSNNNLLKKGNFTIYPNPVNEFFIIQKESSKEKNCIVYTMDGRQIKTISLKTKKTIIPTKSWKKGIYILRIDEKSQNLICLPY